MMDMVQGLRAVLKETETELDQVQSELDNLEIRTKELRSKLTTILREREALKNAIQRRGGSVNDGIDGRVPSSPNSDPELFPASDDQQSLEDWTLMTRMAAVERALREIGRPAAPEDIRLFLAAAGRNDKGHYISSTLSNLKVRNRAVRTGYGEWVPADSAPRTNEGEAR